MSTSISQLSIVAVIAGALLGGCGNQFGNTAASHQGDTSRPAERGSPIMALEAACGPATMTPAGVAVISRQPYLQQVSASSAIVGWVTTAAATAKESVKVTTPDGSPVTTALAEIEETTLRMAAEKQKWATVSGLEADTTYCYEVTNEKAALSTRIGFRTAPATGSTKPIRFLAFGDSGSGETDQFDALEQMLTVPFDFVIHLGDLAYDHGTLAQIEDTVFRVYADMFRHFSFFPTAGNHEYETEKAKPYREAFKLPNNEKWYSYDWGSIHFAVLDTEMPYEEQAAWLAEDLAASTQPWKIVYLHKPPYSSGNHGSDTAARKIFGPIFEKHGVQLVLAGHDHHYERMKPQGGVAYVVTGGGGMGTRSAGESSFTAFSDEVIHFVYVEVAEDQLVLHAIDASGAEFDSMVVPRVSAE